MRYGHFDNSTREYVIERPDIPVSWTNYIGVENLCTVLSHNAGGYSFYTHAEHQRVGPPPGAEERRLALGAGLLSFHGRGGS